MSTPSILAAVIAFVACMLAIGAFRRTNARSRRKIPASSKRSNFLNYNLTMVRGPSQKQWLASAGFFSPDASKIYAAVTIGAVFLGGCLGGIAGRWIEMGTVGVFALAFAGAFVFSRIPASWINARWSNRSRQVAGAFPLMLDMLEVCSRAGQSLDESWANVRSQLREINPVLAEEMELVELEVRLGQDRTVALRSLAERTGVSDVAALATLLDHSNRFGAGLSETFRGQSDAMRKDYVLSLEENAHTLEVTAAFSMVVLMMPAIFLIAVVPLGIIIIRNLSGINS